MLQTVLLHAGPNRHPGRKRLRSLVVAAGCLLLGGCVAAARPPVRFVDPFIGTAENGHTFPNACVPFGMIQAGPQTGNCEWRYTAGYQYRDTLTTGFSQTRLSGTGVPDLGDLLLFPFTGESTRDRYESPLDKSSETARPGYYAVRMSDTGIRCEMTAAEHVALHRYRYPPNEAQHLLLDVQTGLVTDRERLPTRVLESSVQFPDNRTVTGYVRCRSWLERRYWFRIDFNRDIIRRTELPKSDPRERAPRWVLSFEPGREPLLVRVSLSRRGPEEAAANLEAEAEDRDFDRIRRSASRAWNDLLGQIEADGSPEQLRIFYTALYHLCQQPNNVADAGEIPCYSTLSLWDTYRAAHPLYTILQPAMAARFVRSMLAQYDHQGFLPVWSLWGGETNCMIANHAVPVIVDACLKGIEGIDPTEAYEAVRRTLTHDHPKSDWTLYDRYGYYPCDLVPREAVSRTLETAYDDHSASLLAAKTGRKEDAAFFARRAGYYKNLLCPQTGFMRGRDSGGGWRTPFDPMAIGHRTGTDAGDYTEGNAWQYTWHVQHDIEGLAAAMGGEEPFTARLDSLFILDDDPEKRHGSVLDVTGHIGQYAHGNEPSHHVAYLYAWTRKPWRTQELVRRIVRTRYLDRPYGLCGNEDCGQMSAWYLFACMGFYPVDPCGGTYVFGAPQLERIRIRLPDGRKLTIRADGLSEANRYVRSITLNGRPITVRYITHAQIMDGGELVFEMTDRPCDYLKNETL